MFGVTGYPKHVLYIDLFPARDEAPGLPEKSFVVAAGLQC